MAESPNFAITINGTPVPVADVISVTVERDMFQPDMAAIAVSNPAGPYSSTEIGSPVEIKIGDDDGTSVYKGEVVGIEGVYRGGDTTKLVFRAMNKFHRLLRHRKSLTFTDKTDEQILKTVVGDAGLSLEWKHEKSIPYKHVYQHNQTDMEFLRMRAARAGCHVWSVGDKVFIKQPDLNAGPVAKYTVTEAVTEAAEGDEGAKAGSALKAFYPRLSSAGIVKKVTVKGWNPEKKELITGVAQTAESNLGQQTAVAGSKNLGGEETFTVDHPVWSKEEADVLAKARLVELSLTYITGEVEVTGDPRIDLGNVISIKVNDEPDTVKTDPFNGRYYVMGVTHRIASSKGKDGGYSTIIRVARNAQKQKQDE